MLSKCSIWFERSNSSAICSLDNIQISTEHDFYLAWTSKKFSQVSTSAVSTWLHFLEVKMWIFRLRKWPPQNLLFFLTSFQLSDAWSEPNHFLVAIWKWRRKLQFSFRKFNLGKCCRSIQPGFSAVDILRYFCEKISLIIK